jgi:phage head maturation protease
MMADEITQTDTLATAPYADPAIQNVGDPADIPLAPDDVEALAASVVETRSAGMKVDDVDFKERTITVIAVPYEKPALVQYRHAMWQEVFSRSAFNGINPRQRTIPVSAQLNQVTESHSHAGSRLVGRVINTYPDSEPGLITDIKVSKGRDGDDTLELANDGVLHPSVGFAMANPHQDQELDRRSMTRRINRAFLHHLSFVGEPAYPDAKVLAVRAGEALHTEADLPPLKETPRMDQWLDDPIVQWAMSQGQGQ